MQVERELVVRYRLRASHLHEKLPAAGSLARAAWGGLQDSAPRAAVISLHARVRGVQASSWDDPSLVQIWFRGGADYVVPRADVGIFTLGSLPRDPEKSRALEQLADDIHRVCEGRTLLVREVQRALGMELPTFIRVSAFTGRVHIRWDASNIWLIPVERPEIDAEDARLELARRFVHWFGPTTKRLMAKWTGVQPGDATKTWRGIEPALVPVDVGGDERWMLERDLDALVGAEPVRGVRLIPIDDPLSKFDREVLVPHDELRNFVFPPKSPGWAPQPVLVDGEVVGAWERQQRKVTVRLRRELSADARATIEEEALSFPIAAKTKPSVHFVD